MDTPVYTKEDYRDLCQYLYTAKNDILDPFALCIKRYLQEGHSIQELQANLILSFPSSCEVLYAPFEDLLLRLSHSPGIWGKHILHWRLNHGR